MSSQSQYSYFKDAVELFINDKKFNLDYAFTTTWDINSKHSCKLTLYNYNPPLHKLSSTDDSSNHLVTIKVNGLVLFNGFFKDIINNLKLTKSDIHTEFTVTLTTNPLALLKKENISKDAKGNLIYNLLKDTLLSHYVKTNHDFTLNQDYQLPIINGKVDFSALIGGHVDKPYVIHGGEILFPFLLGITQLKKIIATVQNADHTLNVACLYNHNVFLGKTFNHTGACGSHDYIITKNITNFSTKTGFSHQFNCVEKDVYTQNNPTTFSAVASSSVIISKAQRSDNTITPENTSTKLQPNLDITPVNKQGNGMLLTVDNTQMYYFEQLNFFKEFKTLLEKLNDLSQELQSSLGTVLASPAP